MATGKNTSSRSKSASAARERVAEESRPDRLHREGDQRRPIVRMDMLQQDQELRWHAIRHSQNAPEFGRPVSFAGIEIDIEDSNVLHVPLLHCRRSLLLSLGFSIAPFWKVK